MPVPKGQRFGGRQKGTPNKVTRDVRELAMEYGPAAIAELARLATGAESEAARVAAIKELLDRAYGKAKQEIAATGRLVIVASGYVPADG